MRSSHRGIGRRKRLLTRAFHGAALMLILALAFGPIGLVSASAADRSRDGSFSSDTDAVSGSSDERSSGGGSDAVAGASISRHDTPPAHEPLAHGGLPDPNITICHRTGSTTNPYIVNNPDASSIITHPTGHTTHVGSPVVGPSIGRAHASTPLT